jgi:hypothetical protein
MAVVMRRLWLLAAFRCHKVMFMQAFAAKSCALKQVLQQFNQTID